MNSTRHSNLLRWGVLLGGATLLGLSLAATVEPSNPLVITSIAVVETNLEFVATFPAGVERAVLELRPDLDSTWEAVATVNVPADGGAVGFTLPKPNLEHAFFRLNITMHTATNNLVSAESQFVVVPPLDAAAKNSSPAEAVFHFKGMIDGSDRIIITHQGALWEHVNWGWPVSVVTVNDSQWNPSEKNFITTTGAVRFLPEKYSLSAARLEVMTNRDVLALERTNGALIVYLNDTPPGAAPCEFKIHFPRTRVKPRPVRSSPSATLKITAQIDGSDVLKITKQEAVWTHRAWDYPAAVRLNDIPWDVRRTNTLSNSGTNQFLPDQVDLSTAKIISRKGRDLATMWADRDAVWVSFADNPNGAEAYELDLSFGSEP